MRDDKMELLLAYGDELEPVLRDGLPHDVSERAPKPKEAVRGADTPDWLRKDADPNDLALQRWGVVVPEGQAGDRLLEAMTPLLRLREREQGAPVMTYRAPADMDAQAAAAWRDEVYWSDAIDEIERPLYLMLLGNVDRVSLELQHSLANCSLVGRAHFADSNGDDNLDAYAAYAEKVVRFAEQGTSRELPNMLFHVARDGSSATQIAENRLLEPCREVVEKNRDSGKLPIRDVLRVEAENGDDFMAAGAANEASVLLSVSHGLGAPRFGWSNDEEQWRKQGALVMGPKDVLDAERFANQTFLPGGLWFMLACFGAGTPSSSAYHGWLSSLAKEGAYTGKAKAVLSSLPCNGARPFMAALPQAALASPRGPLGIIGHIDLAWTYGFSSATNLNESRKSRFSAAMEVLARGSRAGAGVEALMRFYRETNDTLMAGYQAEAEARAQNRAITTNYKERGHLWMLRNDLRGYVLLGDPAVRLSITKNIVAPVRTEVVVSPEVSRPEVSLENTLSVHAKEAAVLSLIRGNEAPEVIAKRAGTTIVELFSWFDTYRAGGRAHLGS